MTQPPSTGHALLTELQAAHVFDPVPLRAGVHGFHVPFDELIGDYRTEAELTRAIKARERVAVAGRSGVGKTSLIQYVVDSLADTVAALRIPVEAESPETVSEPPAFAGHLLRTVARQLREAHLIGPAEQRGLLASTSRSVRVADHRSGRSGLGLPRWLLQADVARDVASVVTADVTPSGGDVIAQARDVVDAIAARGLTPVLVIDDSDAWLRTPAGDRTANVGPFFNRVVRMLAEELNAALIVAVHDHYQRLPEFPSAAGFLEATVHVPGLPSAASFARIVHTRVTTYNVIDIPLEQVMTDRAVDALFARYQHLDGNIRTTLLAAHTALQAACEDQAEQIDAEHIRIALTRYDDAYSDPG